MRRSYSKRNLRGEIYLSDKSISGIMLKVSLIDSPTPLSFFADVLWSRYMSRTAAKMEIFQQKDECSLNLRSPVRQVSGCVDRKRGGDSAKENREILLGVKTELSQKLKAMNFIGRFVAACIADGMHINLNLSSPFIKQVKCENHLNIIISFMPLKYLYANILWVNSWLEHLT